MNYPTLRLLLLLLLLLPAGLSAQPYATLTWTVADGLPVNDITALAQDRTGFLWIGTDGGGLARFDGETFVNFTISDGLPSNRIEAIRTGEDDQLYVATPAGMVKLAADGQTLRNVPEDLTPDVYRNSSAPPLPEGFASARLPGTRVRARILDRQHRLWVGTDGGLVRLLPSPVRDFTAKGQLAGDRINTLAISPGRHWIGGARSGLFRYRDGRFERLPVDNPLRSGGLTRLIHHAGNSYLAQNSGVTVINDTLGVERLTRRSGLLDDRIVALIPADSSQLFAVGENGNVSLVSATDSNTLVTTYFADSLPSNPRFAFRIDTTLLLIGETGELSRINTAGSRERLARPRGLPEGLVTAAALRRGTQLWLVVRGQGLLFTDLRLRPLRFARPPARLQNLPTNIRTLFAPSKSPEIWLGTDRDLVRVYLDGNGHPDWSRTYGRAEGFPVTTTLTAAEAADETLWFGTTRGLISLMPDAKDGYLFPPKVFLQGVDLFYTPLDSVLQVTDGGTTQLAATQNHLNFRFRAVELTYPERLRYAYRLKGLNKDWSPPTAETSVRFAGLAPGAYTFAVRATTDGGKTWSTPTDYRFRIAAPWWQQTWFLLLAATLLVVGLVLGGYQIYRRAQRTEARKRRALEVQNQLLTLEQKALQLQMNPHFIFNALNGIRGLIEGTQGREARRQISLFAALMRGILNNSRQEKVSLSDEIATLTNYLEMERFCQPFDFRYLFDVPTDIDPEEVSLPTMLLQPFLENAILHGFPTSPRDREIRIVFSMRGRRMQCQITDNGVGRAAARKEQRRAAHQPVALEVTRDRLHTLGGSLTIRDFVNEEGQGLGTEIILVFPVSGWDA